MAMTYIEANRRLGRRVSVQIDKVRGTEFRRAPGEAGERGDVQVRYRGTAVVTLHPDETYTLRTGGTYSKTVIKRIAEYAPVALRRERNGVYIEDVDRGRWVPFMEGMRVDVEGHLLNPAPSVRATSTVAEEPAAYGETAGSDGQNANLIALIRQVVQEALGETALTPQRAPAPTPRKVDVRVTARQVEPAVQVPIDVVEKMFRTQLPPEKAKRAIAELYGAFARGRKPRETDADGPAPTQANLVLCPDCKEPLVSHYDRANRLKGCEYALKHKGEQADLQ